MRSMAGFKQDGMGDYYLPWEMAEELGCEAYFHDQIDKSGILNRFRSGQLQVIVAMSALGRGLIFHRFDRNPSFLGRSPRFLFRSVLRKRIPKMYAYVVIVANTAMVTRCLVQLAVRARLSPIYSVGSPFFILPLPDLGR